MIDSLLNILLEKSNNIVLAFFKVFVANICCNRKAWWHRNSNKVHLSQVGTLTTEQVSHVGLALCLTVTKGINSFFVHNRIGSNVLVIVFINYDANIQHFFYTTKLFTIFLLSRLYIFGCSRTHTYISLEASQENMKTSENSESGTRP